MRVGVGVRVRVRVRVGVGALLAALTVTGCGTYPRLGVEPARARGLEQNLISPHNRLSPEQEAKILALDARDVSEPRSMTAQHKEIRIRLRSRVGRSR